MSGYARVAEDEDAATTLLPPASDATNTSWVHLKEGSGERTFRKWWPWAAHAVLLSISLTVLFMAWRTEESRCARKLSVYC